MSYVCAGKSFKSLSDAKVYAELVFKSKGIVAGIEAKPKKMSAKKIMEARVNRAVVGFVIPMMSIPKMCKALEEAIAAGWSDEELKSIVASYSGWREGEACDEEAQDHQ